MKPVSRWLTCRCACDIWLWEKYKRSRTFLFFFDFFSKFSRKIVETILFRSSFGRSGSSGKSRATRRQNSSLLRRLATTKRSKKRFGKNRFFLGFGNQFFRYFSWILEGIDNFKRQNRFPREILLQIHLFWGPCDLKLGKNYLCCEKLASASHVGGQGGGVGHLPTDTEW